MALYFKLFPGLVVSSVEYLVNILSFLFVIDLFLPGLPIRLPIIKKYKINGIWKETRDLNKVN
jgi:hypothetical protein